MSFFNDIHIPGTLLQVGEVNRTTVVDSKAELEAFLKRNRSEDLYFCANVKKEAGSSRAKNSDVEFKKYLYFDFDIRKDLKVKGISVTDEDIESIAARIKDDLNNHNFFKHWSYIIFSGNGLHVYYISDEAVKVDLDCYSLGYQLYANKIQKATMYVPDTACKNVARIARIPNSYNCKIKSNKKLVKVLHQKDARSNIVKLIMQNGKKELERREGVQEFEQRLLEIKKRERLYNIDEIIEIINRLPIENEVKNDYPSWHFDGKHFVDIHNKSVTAAYVHDNLLIISESRWFNDIRYKGCGTYLYRREKSLMTDRQAIEYFKENYNLKI